MAYFIRKLRKKKEGEVVKIQSSLKRYNVQLFKKNLSECYSFNEKKEPFKTFCIENYKSDIIIPITGIWELAIKSNDSSIGLYFIEEL